MQRQDYTDGIHTTPELGKLGHPLVIKGVERIEAIILPDEAVRREAELYTHALSRIMRRDYNLTSVKIFWFAKGFRRRMRAKALLYELVAEADRLEDLARPYELPKVNPVATCTFRIVSDDTGVLFDALVTADRALLKLLHSPIAEDAEQNITPFVRSFTALRKEVFGFFGG